MRRGLGSSLRALVLVGTVMTVALLPGTAFAALPTEPTAARPCGPSIERQPRALVRGTARDPIPGVILDVRGPGCDSPTRPGSSPSVAARCGSATRSAPPA